MNLLSTIGNTPLVELRSLKINPNVKIFGKIEGLNPGGSIKDRPAHYMIEKAEESGELTKEKTILEPTSGNTGISLAMIGAIKGYRVKLCMPACASLERRHIIEVFGAEVVLTPSEENTDGAIKRVHALVHDEPEKYYFPNQFENKYNVLAHYETTGPEIWAQTGGNIDGFVAGIGSGGTLVGTSTYLRKKNPDIKIIAAEPTSGHKIQGLKNMKEAIIPKIYNPNAWDEKITVKDDPAYKLARQLAEKEGIFVGMSSGAAVVAAILVAQKLKSGNIVVILPDRGERYLSTTLFRSTCGKCPP